MCISSLGFIRFCLGNQGTLQRLLRWHCPWWPPQLECKVPAENSWNAMVTMGMIMCMHISHVFMYIHIICIYILYTCIVSTYMIYIYVLFTCIVPALTPTEKEISSVNFLLWDLRCKEFTERATAEGTKPRHSTETGERWPMFKGTCWECGPRHPQQTGRQVGQVGATAYRALKNKHQECKHRDTSCWSCGSGMQLSQSKNPTQVNLFGEIQ